MEWVINPDALANEGHSEQGLESLMKCGFVSLKGEDTVHLDVSMGVLDLDHEDAVIQLRWAIQGVGESSLAMDSIVAWMEEADIQADELLGSPSHWLS